MFWQIMKKIGNAQMKKHDIAICEYALSMTDYCALTDFRVFIDVRPDEDSEAQNMMESILSLCESSIRDKLSDMDISIKKEYEEINNMLSSRTYIHANRDYNSSCMCSVTLQKATEISHAFFHIAPRSHRRIIVSFDMRNSCYINDVVSIQKVLIELIKYIDSTCTHKKKNVYPYWERVLELCSIIEKNHNALVG